MRCRFAEVEVEKEDCVDSAGTNTGLTRLVLGGGNAQVWAAVSAANDVVPQNTCAFVLFLRQSAWLAIILVLGGHASTTIFPHNCCNIQCIYHYFCGISVLRYDTIVSYLIMHLKYWIFMRCELLNHTPMLLYQPYL